MNIAGISVEVSEQPASTAMRFRYECEGRSTGSIPGAHSTAESRSYPSIRVHGYSGRVKVVVSCVSSTAPHRTHPTNLCGPQCDDGVAVHEGFIRQQQNLVTFPQLRIQCVKRKDVQQILLKRQLMGIDPFNAGFDHIANRHLVDQHSLRLCFQVFVQTGKYNSSGAEVLTPLEPIVSNVMYDKKSNIDLTMVDFSLTFGSCAGGDKLIIISEKVLKEDIAVRFFVPRSDASSLDGGESQPLWSALGDMTPSDVHRQVAMVLRTPPYRGGRPIGEPVSAFLQLYRPSDGATSQPVGFTYLPDYPEDQYIAKRGRSEKSQCLQNVQDGNCVGVALSNAASTAASNAALMAANEPQEQQLQQQHQQHQQQQSHQPQQQQQQQQQYKQSHQRHLLQQQHHQQQQQQLQQVHQSHQLQQQHQRSQQNPQMQLTHVVYPEQQQQQQHQQDHQQPQSQNQEPTWQLLDSQQKLQLQPPRQRHSNQPAQHNNYSQSQQQSQHYQQNQQIQLQETVLLSVEQHQHKSMHRHSGTEHSVQQIQQHQQQIRLQTHGQRHSTQQHQPYTVHQSQQQQQNRLLHRQQLQQVNENILLPSEPQQLLQSTEYQPHPPQMNHQQQKLPIKHLAGQLRANQPTQQSSQPQQQNQELSVEQHPSNQQIQQRTQLNQHLQHNQHLQCQGNILRQHKAAVVQQPGQLQTIQIPQQRTENQLQPQQHQQPQIQKNMLMPVACQPQPNLHAQQSQQVQNNYFFMAPNTPIAIVEQDPHQTVHQQQDVLRRRSQHIIQPLQQQKCLPQQQLMPIQTQQQLCLEPELIQQNVPQLQSQNQNQSHTGITQSQQQGQMGMRLQQQPSQQLHMQDQHQHQHRMLPQSHLIAQSFQMQQAN